MTPDPDDSAVSRLAHSRRRTLLRADATARDIERLCAEAREHRFHCVCVNGSRIVEAVQHLEDSGIKVASTIGFPLGASDPDAKRFETEAAIDNGAHEKSTS